jgi:hypothetical protein
MSFGAEALSMKCCSLHRSPSDPIFSNKAKKRTYYCNVEVGEAPAIVVLGVRTPSR